MQETLMLTAFLLPAVAVAYWLIVDWIKERTLRRRWITQPLLSKAIKHRARLQHAHEINVPARS